MKFQRFLTTVALSLILCAVSCAAPHDHVYAEDWTFDATAHWKQPLCDDVSPVKEAHVFESGVCSVCQYTESHETSSESGKPSEQNPEGSQPSEAQKPSGGENQTPEQKPEEGKTPEEQKPEEGTTPEEPKPSGGERRP